MKKYALPQEPLEIKVVELTEVIKDWKNLKGRKYGRGIRKFISVVY